MVEIEEQPTNVRTWKCILRQPNPNEARVQPKPERKRKQSTSDVDYLEFSHKHMHVSQEVQNLNNPMVEVVEQPREEP